MQHFNANHFAARHFALAQLRGVLEQVALKKGGDDAFHHPLRKNPHKGWDKKAWEKKKARDDLFAETIAKTYEQVMGIEPPAQIVEEVAKQAIVEQPKIIQVPYANYDGLEEWLQSQQQLVKLIIQKRIEAEDEEDIEMLLLY